MLLKSSSWNYRRQKTNSSNKEEVAKDDISDDDEDGDNDEIQGQWIDDV